TDSSASITRYAWTFGDGGFSLSPNPTNAFFVAGTYDVRLTISDSLGRTTTKDVIITVGDGLSSGGGGGSAMAVIAASSLGTSSTMRDSRRVDLLFSNQQAGLDTSVQTGALPLDTPGPNVSHRVMRHHNLQQDALRDLLF